MKSTTMTMAVTFLLSVTALAQLSKVTEEQCRKFQDKFYPLSVVKRALGQPTVVIRSQAEASRAAKKYNALISSGGIRLYYITSDTAHEFYQTSDGKVQYVVSNKRLSSSQASRLSSQANNRKAHQWFKIPGYSQRTAGHIVEVFVDGKLDYYLTGAAKMWKETPAPSKAQLDKVLGQPHRRFTLNQKLTGPVAELQSYLSVSSKAERYVVYKHPKNANVLYVVSESRGRKWGLPVGTPPGY